MKSLKSLTQSTLLWSRNKAALFLSAVVLTTGLSGPAQAEPMREFIMSCSYGVLAGTLVGAASLAFTDQPGDNLNRVARGASLGLYAGIALGFYVAYMIPNEEPPGHMYEAPGYLPREGSWKARKTLPKITLLPTFSEKGMDGAMVNWRVMSFN